MVDDLDALQTIPLGSFLKVKIKHNLLFEFSCKELRLFSQAPVRKRPPRIVAGL